MPRNTVNSISAGTSDDTSTGTSPVPLAGTAQTMQTSQAIPVDEGQDGERGGQPQLGSERRIVFDRVRSGTADSHRYDNLWRLPTEAYPSYYPKFDEEDGWILAFAINTTDQAGMFKMVVSGTGSKTLEISPAKILGTDIPTFEGCQFFISLDAPHVKFSNNTFYSSWASFADFVTDDIVICYDSAGNAKDYNKEVLLALLRQPAYAFSLRFSLNFGTDKGHSVVDLQIRGFPKPKEELIDYKWSCSSTCTILVDSLPLNTLDMDPEIVAHGYPLPIYPTLFSPQGITMLEYESFTLRTLPCMLSLVKSSKDMSPVTIQEYINGTGQHKNPLRFSKILPPNKNKRSMSDHSDPLTGYQAQRGIRRRSLMSHHKV